ncbi:ribonuclease domain-containing protein [Streptomyces sp. NK08204]|uniref:ribonuclease domain-containing protein n=1 Tax=Streptomyces sp. NK08204 TaxID=2873260 RepID=UPI001CEC57AB|nr:ribonuclease domain-containing protein [Streptomyces sp. NK08204]
MLPRFVPHALGRRVPRSLAGLLVALAVLLTGCSSGSAVSATQATQASHAATASSVGRTSKATAAPAPAWARGMRTVEVSRLPPEARQTLALIDRGGPFPYARDGVVFGNFEGLLPTHRRGYYHEYTVRTPGSYDRGARRIVTGHNAEIYYTDDHYESFRAVLR